MITIDIPGYPSLQLHHLVLDYNGTLAQDGKLIPGVSALLKTLSSTIQIHIVTADTFGHAAEQLRGLPMTTLPAGNQIQAKKTFVEALGHTGVIAIGNGRNDSGMLQTAAIGIALIQKEGAAAQTIASADIICTHIIDALELLMHPKRLIATLRM